MFVSKKDESHSPQQYKIKWKINNPQPSDVACGPLSLFYAESLVCNLFDTLEEVVPNMDFVTGLAMHHALNLQNSSTKERIFKLKFDPTTARYKTHIAFAC